MDIKPPLDLDATTAVDTIHKLAQMFWVLAILHSSFQSKQDFEKEPDDALAFKDIKKLFLNNKVKNTRSELL
ncbi:MAG: hypothetical protein FWB71_01885 [Defluviitaleaceae bacterium]|nr:hypothetical protein [Defluviitaleaceae bacterium]